MNETDPVDTGMDEDDVGEVQGESEELVIELDSAMQECVLGSVICSAHTLQLAVDDALKVQRSANLISKARQVGKIVILLKRMEQKRAIVGCPTRWHSTQDMLERLLELRNSCEDMSPNIKELHLSDNEWEEILQTWRVL